jgi:uncharacterized protein
MDPQLIAGNLLNPPILFFFLGVLAALVRSNLEIPQTVARILSLYLLLAIGFRGGVELRAGGFSSEVLIALLLAVGMAVVVPVYTFAILRLRLDVFNSAALAATYGSISAVTFITAASFLAQQGIVFGGHMVAAMALMESPAVVVGVVLARYFGRSTDGPARRIAWPELLRDSFLNGSVFLLIGSMFIGGLAGEAGAEAMRPLTDDLFKGLLAFFLLDMGIIAARRARELRSSGAFLLGFAILVPLFNAAVGLALAKLAGMGEGDALMFTILCASASYIAVPAAVRIAIPEANPTLYISTALAVTFPFNIVIGIPLYMGLIRAWWS